MGPLGRIITLTMLLIAAGLAMAQSPDGPPDYQLLRGDSEEGIQEQNCWGCHKPGAYDPPMDPYVAITPELIDFPADPEAPIQLTTVLSNVWINGQSDRTHEQKWFRVTLDISDAPSLSFVSEQEPYEGPTVPGEIVIDPQELLTDPQALTRDHSGSALVEIPTGATEAVIRIIPDDRDTTTGPDLKVNLYPGFDAPSGDPFNDEPINNAGRGGVETFRADLSTFAASGYGNWSIEALARPVDTGNNQVTPFIQPIGFTVQVDAWFNASAATQMVQTQDPALEPGQRALLTWPLQVGTPSPEESLRFVLNFTYYYDHQAGDKPRDDWRDLTETFEVPIETRDDGGYRIGQEAAIIVPVGGPTGVSIAAISEVIGYISAFLLVASVWTGGMFGKTSRRQLNTVFGSARRRVAFHNFLSYGIIAFALVHMLIFILDMDTVFGGENPFSVDGYHWLVGVLWGGQGTLALLLLGVTGALQVPMIRKWNYGTWRWIHFGLAIAAIVFTLVHMFLDGPHFVDIQDALGWEDPLVPDEF